MEFYEPKGFAKEIFTSRYAIHENETWEEACERVSTHVSMAESGDLIGKFREDTNDILKKNLFMPGGRIWNGSGRAKGQLLNCFVIPTEDSREGWGKTVSDMIIISGVGGGVGLNGSPVRPRGSEINGSGGKATGAVSLMEIIDAAGSVIKAGGGRRTALMFALNLGHGDLLEFLDKKLDLDQLTNANVSVVFDENPELFFEKVKKKETFYFYHRGKEIGSIPAEKLWHKIVSNAVTSGEPGLLNGYYANRMSNLWYWKVLVSTNPCGEIWMAPYECCCLGSLVLPRFVTERGFSWTLLKDTVRKAVRFLDNVLSVNNYPLPEITETCKSVRRIGLGVMGLHDVLLMSGLKYDSPEGLEYVDKLMKTIKNYAYEASVELAIEKGSFPVFDTDKFLKSQFVKTLKPTIRRMIREHGIRNCALLTIAPTGTTSIVCDVTSALEPMFAPGHKRKYRDLDDELQEEIIVHPLFKRFLLEGKDVSHFQGAHEISIRDHFEMQRACQMHVDNAVSKTINIPAGTSIEMLSELYMEFFPELKGTTVYPDGSRENQPLTPIPLEEAIKYAMMAKEEATTQDSCKDGKCDI